MPSSDARFIGFALPLFLACGRPHASPVPTAPPQNGTDLQALQESTVTEPPPKPPTVDASAPAARALPPGPTFGEVLACAAPPLVWKAGAERFVTAGAFGTHWAGRNASPATPGAGFFARASGSLDRSLAGGLDSPGAYRYLTALEGAYPKLRARFSAVTRHMEDEAPASRPADTWMTWDGQHWAAAGAAAAQRAPRVYTYPWAAGSTLSATILDAGYRKLAPPIFSVSGTTVRPDLRAIGGANCDWHIHAVDKTGTIVLGLHCDGGSSVVVWRDGRAFVPNFPNGRPRRDSIVRAFARDGEVVVETMGESRVPSPVIWRLENDALIQVRTPPNAPLHLEGLEARGIVWAIERTDHALHRWSSATGWERVDLPPIERVLAWSDDGAPAWASTRDGSLVSRDAAGGWRRSALPLSDGGRVREFVEDGEHPWLSTERHSTGEPYRLYRAGWAEPSIACGVTDIWKR